MEKKHVRDSLTEKFQMIMPAHLNSANRLFGGQLALWIDEVAGVVAIRHAGGNIVTAMIDHLEFREPVLQGEIIVLVGRLTYVGTTSMEVRVDTYVEAGGRRKLINTAFLVEVAIDEQGRAAPVPGLICETAEEKRAFAAGKRRKEFRQIAKQTLYEIDNTPCGTQD